ncbi:MAG: hypothetical protein JKY52_08605 [Flavobacteriales bacterium]|nr:hypothetical protein [Flavobacteriales bacterium]
MKVKVSGYGQGTRIHGKPTKVAFLPINGWSSGSLTPALQSHVVGTRKMCELCLGRLKPAETPGEGRSGADVQIVRPTWV